MPRIRTLLPFLLLVLMAERALASSSVVEVLPDQLDALPIPLNVQVEAGEDGTMTLRAVVEVSDELPREYLDAYLRLARGDRLLAWIQVARLDHREKPLAEFHVTLAREFTANSYLEIQVSRGVMPAFDGYRLPLAKYAPARKRWFEWWPW